MPDATAIEVWIAGRAAARLGTSPDGIDRSMPFKKLGLSSRDLVALSGELEDELGVSVCPIVAWEFPTIGTLARHLASLTR